MLRQFSGSMLGVRSVESRNGAEGRLVRSGCGRPEGPGDAKELNQVFDLVFVGL